MLNVNVHCKSSFWYDMATRLAAFSRFTLARLRFVAQRAASRTMQRCARAFLAKLMIRGARAAREENEARVVRCVKRIKHRKVLGAFSTWQEKAHNAALCKRLLAKLQGKSPRALFHMWSKHAIALAGARRRAAAVRIQALARGYVLRQQWASNLDSRR